MISARAALKLPSAVLRASDAEAAKELLQDIRGYVETHMDRGGCVVPVEPTRINGAISAEVIRICRSLGWEAEFQQKIGKSPITGQPTVLGFQLSLQPQPEAYDEPMDGHDVWHTPVVLENPKGYKGFNR